MRKQKQEEYKGYRTAGIRLMEPMLAGLPSFLRRAGRRGPLSLSPVRQSPLGDAGGRGSNPEDRCGIDAQGAQEHGAGQDCGVEDGGGGCNALRGVFSNKAAGRGGGGQDAPGPELGGPARGLAAVPAKGRADHADGGNQPPAWGLSAGSG